MKALICGAGGQDGAYLVKFLLDKGYEIIGTSRDAQASTFSNLESIGVREKITMVSMNITDFDSVHHTLEKYCPDEIYNLAGQSSVGLSFKLPVETMKSISIGTLNLLEAIRRIEKPIKYYSAGSGECFGNTGGMSADESTPFQPRSPYAVAKSAAFWEVANYRQAYKLFACSGILFNHDSPLRPEHFVTRKIIAAAVRISLGSKEKLVLGNIDIERDWGWAPDYVEAMWLMLQQDSPDDFVIATGETNPLKEFVDTAFAHVGLNWQQNVVSDSGLFRPSDLAISRANPGKAKQKLNWSAQHKMKDVVRVMMEAEIENVTSN